MEFRSVRALRGPNVWARVPVLEAWVDLGALDRPSDRFPGLTERLLGWLSPLSGPLAALVGDLQHGADLGDLLAQLALELQARAGSAVDFGGSEATPEPGVRCVAVAYQYE